MNLHQVLEPLQGPVGIAPVLNPQAFLGAYPPAGSALTPAVTTVGFLTCGNNKTGVSEGIRTPDIQDHNLAL